MKEYDTYVTDVLHAQALRMLTYAGVCCSSAMKEYDTYVTDVVQVEALRTVCKVLASVRYTVSIRNIYIGLGGRLGLRPHTPVA